MAQRQYASTTEFDDWDEDDDYPTPTDSKLRRASGVIDGLTRNSRYDVDEDGYPTDPDVTDAFRDATCAQVAWFEETDDPTGAGSQDGTFTIGSVSIGARGRSTGNGAPDAASSRISPEAVEVLTNAGLITAITAHR